MGSFWEDDGEGSVTIGHYCVKGNYCRVNKLEILTQVVGSIGYFHLEVGDNKGEGVEHRRLFL